MDHNRLGVSAHYVWTVHNTEGKESKFQIFCMEPEGAAPLLNLVVTQPELDSSCLFASQTNMIPVLNNLNSSESGVYKK